MRPCPSAGLPAATGGAIGSGVGAGGSRLTHAATGRHAISSAARAKTGIVMLVRRLSLVSLLVCAGCAVKVPRPPPGVKISIRPPPVRVDVRTQVQVQGGVQVAQPQPPPPPVVIVPIVDAPVPEFFGVSLEGAQDVVFVLDVSGSMDNLAQGRLAEIPVAPVAAPPPAEPPPPDPYQPPPPPPDPYQPPPPPPAPVSPPQPRKIDVAQSELIDALRRLPAGTRMNVVFFNSDLEAISPSLVVLDETWRQGLISFVRDKQPTGSTALTPAMRMAFLMNARRIVLLSDGLGNVGGNEDVLLRDAREAVRGGVRIDTIGLGTDQHGPLLQALARESGGLYQPL